MSFEKHARTVSLLTLVSRASGLLRDAAQSRVFGAGPVMDAFAFAFMLPNLFRRLFGEGALSSSFLPVYAKLDHADPRAAQRFASVTITLLSIVVSLLTIAGEGVLLSLPAADANQRLSFQLMAIMLPYMPLVCVVAFIGSVLNSHGRFAAAAASPILLNAAIVAASAGVSWVHGPIERPIHIHIVAWSVVVAGALQLAWMAWSLRGFGVRWSLQWRDSRDALRTMLATMLPMLVGLGVFQLNTFVDGVIASYPTVVGPTIFGAAFPLDTGSNATLNYAQRLYEFPLGVFGIAIATAIFPTLSRQAGDPPLFRHTLRRGVRLALFIGLPASAGLVVVRHPLTAVIFQGGRFTAEDTSRVTTVLLGYAPAVAAFSVMHTMTRAFYALGDSRTPTRVSLSMVALNFLLNCTLIWTPLGVAGLAWSTTICAWIQAVVLIRILGRRVGDLFDLHTRLATLKIMAATLVMTACTAVVSWGLPPSNSWSRWAMDLGLLTMVGIVGIFGTAIWWRMPEWRWALGRGDQELQAIDAGP